MYGTFIVLCLQYNNHMPTSISYNRQPVAHRQGEPKNTNVFFKLLVVIYRVFAGLSSRRQAASIHKGMEQARAIKEGKVKAKSFEEAIAEL